MAKKNNQKAAKNRQKKLAKRKTHQKTQQKITRQLQSVSLKELFKDPLKFKVVHSLISSTLFEGTGMGIITIAWKLSPQKLGVAQILADTLNRGIKDCFVQLMDHEEYSMRLSYMRDDFELISWSPGKIKGYLINLERFFMGHNIKSHPKYYSEIEKLLAPFEVEALEENEDQTFGLNSNPVFIETAENLDDTLPSIASRFKSFEALNHHLENEYARQFPDPDEDQIDCVYSEDQLQRLARNHPEYESLFDIEQIWHERTLEREKYGKLLDALLQLGKEHLINDFAFRAQLLMDLMLAWNIATHQPDGTITIPEDHKLQILEKQEIRELVKRKRKLFPDDPRIVTGISGDPKKGLKGFNVLLYFMIDRVISEADRML